MGVRLGDVVLCEWTQNGKYKYVGIVFEQTGIDKHRFWTAMWAEGKPLSSFHALHEGDLTVVGSILDFHLRITRKELRKILSELC